MKSGKTKYVQVKVNLSQYEGMHKDRKCAGKWDITFTNDSHFTIDGLGPVSVPWIPLVTCYSCQTSYEFPKFREFIEGLAVRHLVISKELLTKRHIRFLRFYFEKTQEEFAAKIGVSDKYEMSKIESEQSERRLDPDRQVRLKLYCAQLLKIQELNALYGINEIDESKSAEIPTSIFPSTKQETEKALRRLKSA